MKKVLSVLLVTVLLFGSVAPFAQASAMDTTQEDTESKAPELERITLDSPPYGSASDYYDLIYTSNSSVALNVAMRAASYAAIKAALAATGVPVSPAGSFASFFTNIINDSEFDPYANDTTLYCTERHYEGQWPDAIKVVRRYYANSARTVYAGQAVFYYWYI